MSKQTITVTIKEDSSYSPSQSCSDVSSITESSILSSESYTSYESSSLETPSESQYSIAFSEECSDLSSVTESSILSCSSDSEYSQ